MRVCQFRHFGNEVRQRTSQRGDGNYPVILNDDAASLQTVTLKAPKSSR
jgi:hypothetical protein